MDAIKLSELLQGIATVKNEQIITQITTDSRDAGENSLFLAIRGERVNGEDYAAGAVSRGAVFVLTENFIPDIPRDMQAVVPDILDASIQMGANVRAKYNIKIVGVTGSVGKTTTKDFVYAALSPFARTVKNTGNQNNELGMPNTIYKFTHRDRYAVLEMGMQSLGDIHKLSMAAKPVGAIITGIGISHLERLKTRENILKAKLEICDGMPDDGILVLNGDDDYLPGIKLDKPYKTVYFSIENPQADVRAADIVQNGRATDFIIKDKEYGDISCRIPTVGNHNVLDAISAYALVTRLGFPPQQTAENLAVYTVSGMRQNMVEKNDVLFIEDCYNAAPDSMKASIDTLKSVAKGRTIAVLGDMLELGDDSRRLHRQVGEYARAKGVDILLTCGERAKDIAAGFGGDAVCFDDQRQLAAHVKEILRPGDTIVFKASFMMRFDMLLQKIYEA